VDAGTLVALVSRDPGAVALFCDFDGTLAPIVADPAAARALPLSLASLEALASRLALVAVVSGRPLAFIGPFFPPGIRLAGLYGLEQRVDGRAHAHASASTWAPLVAAAAARARSELPPAAGVEEKSLSLTLHYRSAPELRPAVEAWAAATATSTGLVPRPAKMSVELHPPVDVDKGSTVRAWADGAGVVVFVGDDIGDLSAFAALAELDGPGRRCVTVAVAGPESPPELLAAADLVLDGPEALARLLAPLAAAAPAES
jgi:trehalose 6-phosphate phosphatase